MLTKTVKKILSNYSSENFGVRKNLARILMNGKLGGTGKLLILPVDQGFEHGPSRSFASNPDAYDPSYHCKFAIEAGLSAYAAPIGMLEAAEEVTSLIPTILKMNSANSLHPATAAPNQAITSCVDDALRLGCSAVGFTIYPGSEDAYMMMEQVSDMMIEAKAKGLATVIWSYPRGNGISKEGETALDVISYAAHIAALMGANIIKVKPPAAYVEQNEAKKVYEKHYPHLISKDSKLDDRIAHIMQSSFAGKRIVIFSGGANKDASSILSEITAIKNGGGNGSIIGRNVFQRPKQEALELMKTLISVYRS